MAGRKYRIGILITLLGGILVCGCASAAPSKSEAWGTKKAVPITPQATVSLYETMREEEFGRRIETARAQMDAIKGQEKREQKDLKSAEREIDGIREDLETYFAQMDAEYRSGKIPFADYRVDKEHIEEYQSRAEEMEKELSMLLGEEK